MVFEKIVTKQVHNAITVLTGEYLNDEWLVFRGGVYEWLGTEQIHHEGDWDFETLNGVSNWLKYIDEHPQAEELKTYAFVEWLVLKRVQLELSTYFFNQ